MAGGDLHYLHNAAPEAAAAEAGELITILHDAVEVLAELPIPTLASVHGATAGAGLSLMLACDYAIAATDTAFVFAYSQIAASPDGGLTWALPRTIGIRKAMEFAFLNGRMTGAEALDCGLVTRLATPEALARETDLFAIQLAELPTKAFARTKRLMRHADRTALDLQLTYEMADFRASVATNDFHEGVGAFFERREPMFEGR
jgi:2-(1,2-epoxy-1,2-dihydrophenyl)acetyl-CoA isomerase